MANCNKLFLDFNDDLRVRKSKVQSLEKSKDSLRNKVKSYFTENHSEYIPNFFIQGSKKMGTMIRTKEDTCDLDDGIYFFQKPDVTGTTLQNWILEAIKDVTNTPPMHKKKCIRVIYQGDYHIDLPIYYKLDEDAHPFLAVKDEEFEESDAKEFIEWFIEKKDEKGQLARIIRYLKAWSDHLLNKMPCGLAMTVLAEDNIEYDDRNDISLKETLKKIHKSLTDDWECVMPTTPFDDLFDDYDETRKRNFLIALYKFIEDADKAIDDERNQLKASKLWKKHLGIYFIEGVDEDVDSKEEALLEKTGYVLSGLGYTDRSGKITNDISGIKNPKHRNYGRKNIE